MERLDHKIEKLFDPSFALNFIESKNSMQAGHVGPLAVTALKKNVSERFYHVVIRYDSPPLAGHPIFCSAHSEERRENAFRALTYIKNNLPSNERESTPIPLFYDETFRAFFYQGMDGNNILQLLNRREADLRGPLELLGTWLAELHQLPAGEEHNFNRHNSLIASVLPGPGHFLPKIEKRFPAYYNLVSQLFEQFVSIEEECAARASIIHGDLHPENVIVDKTNEHISIIDYTDICVADPMRDLGSFIQQLGFMGLGKRNKADIEAMQHWFLKAYETARKSAFTDTERKRIRLYQAWTAFRSTVYFLTKEPAEVREAQHAITLSKQLAEKL